MAKLAPDREHMVNTILNLCRPQRQLVQTLDIAGTAMNARGVEHAMVSIASCNGAVSTRVTGHQGRYLAGDGYGTGRM